MRRRRIYRWETTLLGMMLGVLQSGCGSSGSSITEIPDDVKYTILATDSIPGVKRQLDVRLSRTVSEKILGAIATKLKDSNPAAYERTLITYYLPGMEVGAGAWATTRFDPDLQVIILGRSADDEKSLTSQLMAHPNAIGKWCDETVGGAVITIYRENGKLHFGEEFSDGSSLKFEAVERPSKLGRRFQDSDRSAGGDYYVIDGQGNLQLRDEEGLIRTAARVP